jgi:hypothetical protein
MKMKARRRAGIVNICICGGRLSARLIDITPAIAVNATINAKRALSSALKDRCSEEFRSNILFSISLSGLIAA